MVGFCPTMYGASAGKTCRLGWLCYLGLVSPGGVLTHVWQWVLTFSRIPTRGLGCTAWWLVPRARVSKGRKEAASVSGLGLPASRASLLQYLVTEAVAELGLQRKDEDPLLLMEK